MIAEDYKIIRDKLYHPDSASCQRYIMRESCKNTNNGISIKANKSPFSSDLIAYIGAAIVVITHSIVKKNRTHEKITLPVKDIVSINSSTRTT
jgi:hypothetical protein|tara:strand:+ start:113 stop:391 length:279 start_codon:yes stop_codon:yes gene_type:complete